MWMAQGEYLTAHALREGAAGHSRESTVEMYRRNGLDDATCAKLLATAILGNKYPKFRKAYVQFRKQQTAKVLADRTPHK